METLKIKLKDKKQSSMIKELLKELGIQFEPVLTPSSESPYDPGFVAKIKQSDKDFEEGRFTKIEPSEIWKLD